MGAWVNIILNKYIPIDFPIYSYSINSLWVCLLKKAISKYYGGYDNLKNISYFELYQILTGFPILHFKRINDKYFLNTHLINQSSLSHYELKIKNSKNKEDSEIKVKELL